MRAPARAALLVCALSLVRCGGDTELPSYRCVKAIDAGNENGGEIASIGSIAYVGGFQTISVYDVSDAADPKTLAPLSMPARVAAIATGGGKLVAATANTLIVFDATMPAAPVLLGRTDTTTIATNALATDGHYAYAGTPNGSVQVFDLSTGTAKMVTQVGFGSLVVTDLLLKGSVLYAGVNSGNGGLVAIDVSNPEQPVPQTPVDVGGNVEGLTLDGGSLWAYTFLAITRTPKPVRIDLGSPLAPKAVDHASGGCNCSASPLTIQVTTAHGHFFGTTPFGNALTIWPQNFSSELDLLPSCPGPAPRVNLTHVSAVGQAILTSGGSLTMFLAP